MNFHLLRENFDKFTEEYTPSVNDQYNTKYVASKGKVGDTEVLVAYPEGYEGAGGFPYANYINWSQKNGGQGRKLLFAKDYNEAKAILQQMKTAPVQEAGKPQRMFRAISYNGMLSKLAILYPSDGAYGKPYFEFLNWKKAAPEGEEREIDFADNLQHAMEIKKTLQRQSTLPAAKINRAYLKKNTVNEVDGDYKYEVIMVDGDTVKTAVLFPSNSPYAKPLEEFERWRDSNTNGGKRREIDTNNSYAEARSYASQLKSGF